MQFTFFFLFLIFWWWLLVYEPKHVALKTYNLLKDVSYHCRLLSSHLVCLCNNRMSRVKILFGTYCTSCSGGYVFCCRHSASWQGERESFCVFFFYSYKIAVPLQAWTGPEGFQEVEAPRTSRHSTHESDNVVSPTHRLPLPPVTPFC